MRCTPLLLLLAGALAAQPPTATPTEPKKIRLEGRVTNTTGEPIRKAAVSLGPNTPNQPNNPDPTPSYTDVTDETGRFSFEDVRPGAYQLRAERSGYVTQRYGARTPADNGTPLALKEGDQLSKLDITLTQQAVIQGRVTDPDGDGVPDVSVRAARFTYQNGVRQFRGEGLGGTTDDEGNFRISGLTPGSYYVVADLQQSSPQRILNPTFNGRSQASATALLSSYYPASLDLRGAIPVEAGPGSHVNADIRVRRERVYTIRGVATNNGAPAARATIAVVAQEELPAMPQGAPAFSASLPFTAFAQTDALGRFEIRNVLPGTHTLRAMGGGRLEVSMPAGGFMTTAGAQGAPVNGYMQVTVPNADVERVVFALGPGSEITTRVSVAGGTLEDLKNDLPKPIITSPGQATSPQIYLPGIRLAPSAGIYVNGPSNNTQPDGTLRITNLFPSRYFLNPTNVPNGWYIRSLRYGGSDLTRAQLEYEGGGGEIEITVAKGTGEIAGTVTQDDGSPAAGLTVSLWPKAPNYGLPGCGVQIATTDQSGAFRFLNLRPEDYLLAAFEEVPEPGLAQYIGFVEAFAADAVTIRLEPDAKPSASLVMVPKQKVAATLIRLRL